MRIHSIQNNNPNFNAKLRVLGKFFVKEELDILTKKADKIGFENDIVELNYTNYKDRSIEFLNQKQPDYLKKISSFLKAKFYPNNDGLGAEFYNESVSDDTYPKFWAKEYKVADYYIEKLMKKYPNERLGISIIEN